LLILKYLFKIFTYRQIHKLSDKFQNYK